MLTRASRLLRHGHTWTTLLRACRLATSRKRRCSYWSVLLRHCWPRRLLMTSETRHRRRHSLVRCLRSSLSPRHRRSLETLMWQRHLRLATVRRRILNRLPLQGQLPSTTLHRSVPTAWKGRIWRRPRKVRWPLRRRRNHRPELLQPWHRRSQTGSLASCSNHRRRNRRLRSSWTRRRTTIASVSRLSRPSPALQAIPAAWILRFACTGFFLLATIFLPR